MASGSQANENSSKARSILEFSNHLLKWLSGESQYIPGSFPDPDIYLHALPLNRSELTVKERSVVEHQGVQIWNACCKLNNNDGELQEGTQLTKARVLAVLLFESTISSKKKDITKYTRVFKNALKAAQECLAHDLLEIGAKVIEQLATYQDKLQNVVNEDSELDSDAVHSLEYDYVLLRIALAWKQSRLDLADHFSSNSLNQIFRNGHTDMTKAIDLFYEIGVQQLKVEEFEMAAKWLKRAYDLLENPDDKSAFPDVSDLKLNILHTYVRALLSIDTPDSCTQAHHHMELLLNEFGHKLAVMLLNLEILASNPESDAETYYMGLVKVIKTVHVIEANHRLILHHIHNLRKLSPRHTVLILKLYMLERLIPLDYHEWTENVIFILIWVLTSDNPSSIPLQGVITNIEDVRKCWKCCLSQQAAHGALILLWKQIEKTSGKDPADTTMKWCQLALDPLFGNAGEKNLVKIRRKLITIHMDNNNIELAKSLLDSMPEQSRNQNLSKYLAYVVALRCGAESDAAAALNTIMKSPDGDNRLFFACVRDTMKFGNRRQGAFLLQRILDRYNYDLPQDIDTEKLLRCTARLLMSVLEDNEDLDIEVLCRLCGIFRAAARFTTKCDEEVQQNVKSCSLEECIWFEQNSRNSAIKCIHSWPTKYVVDLIAYSSQVQYPPEACSSDRLLQLRHRCENAYIQAVLYTSEARKSSTTSTIEEIPRTAYKSQQKPEQKDLRYILYKNVFDQYNYIQQQCIEVADHKLPEAPEIHLDLHQKLITLLPLSFEAVVFISSSTLPTGLPMETITLDELINQARLLEAPSKTYALLADIVLSASTSTPPEGTTNEMPYMHIPIPQATILLCKVIDTMRQQQGYNIVRAARWIRCVVQIVLDSRTTANTTLTDQEHDPEPHPLQMVNAIVNQAIDLARTAAEAALAQSQSQPPSQSPTPLYTQRHTADNEPIQDHDLSRTSIGQYSLYPADELEWLSTTLFNLAIDFYIAENEEHAKSWARLACRLADVLGLLPAIGVEGNGRGGSKDEGLALDRVVVDGGGGDGGVLARVLRQKCAELGWDF